MMHRYFPPRFDLFEFDDESFQSGQPRRWFNGWNGPVDEPAEEVSLAWSAGEAAALVATSGRFPDREWARLSAAHLALGGNALPITDRPGTAQAVQQEIQRIASTEELWSPGPVLEAGSTPAEVAVGDGFAVACGRVSGKTVLIAAVGVRPDQFRVRTVRDWDAYGLDATKSHSMSELKRLAGHSGD
jgi:hypothetical protein